LEDLWVQDITTGDESSIVCRNALFQSFVDHIVPKGLVDVRQAMFDISHFEPTSRASAGWLLELAPLLCILRILPKYISLKVAVRVIWVIMQCRV
jgi:hypothetical protein